ncbi:hypothetical protein CBR_g19999 [Chara braunii]|uniref:DNA methylase N-4/N-6 domain-containing protein n=1 Tax=Chara braunii TaxID=69332 RepID=A0A388KZ86_CHABU|nr:hypothetical protein CBR_g19999 [Chara braunii]|eukprot:GBG75370.1 hypothetical protein CBR_g19999 [Chara braunii]
MEDSSLEVKPVPPKKKKATRFDAAEALRQANQFFNPHAPMEDGKIVAEAINMHQAPWVEMGSLDDDSVLPILEQVVAKQLAIEGMRKKYEVAKRLGRVVKFFVNETGSTDWDECKSLYPMHTTKDLLEPFESNWRAKGDVPKALVAHVERAKAWKELNDKRVGESRRTKQKMAMAEEATAHFSDWTEIRDGDHSGFVKVLEGDMLDLNNLQKPLPFSLTICDFPYGFDLPMSVDDNRHFPEDDIVHVLQNIKEVCMGPLWTVVGFCSLDVMSYVRSAFAMVCHSGQEVITWCKPNVMNTDGPRLISATKFCVIGYYSVSGKREAAHYNFASTDVLHNYRIFDAVMKKYNHPLDLEVLCPYQKPVALYDWLVDKFSPPGSYVIDAFSGSGTGAIACVLCNRNCLVVEKNSRCISGIRSRILNDIGPTIERERRRKEAEEEEKHYNHAFIAEEEVTGTSAQPTHDELKVISPAKIMLAPSAVSGEAVTTTAAQAVMGEGAPAAAEGTAATGAAAAAREARVVGPVATATATTPTTAAAAAQRSQGSCAEPAASQDSSRGTTTRSRKRKLAAEEVTSPKATTHVIALSSKGH